MNPASPEEISRPPFSSSIYATPIVRVPNRAQASMDRNGGIPGRMKGMATSMQIPDIRVMMMVMSSDGYRFTCTSCVAKPVVMTTAAPRPSRSRGLAAARPMMAMPAIAMLPATRKRAVTRSRSQMKAMPVVMKGRAA